jgi:uncharacterized membrane protein
MGAGMAFFAHSRRALGWSEIRIVRYFAIRGGILILLQLNLENSAWLLGSAGGAPAIIAPGADGQVWIHLGVLYALGCSMILCSLLTRLHPAIVMIGGILTLLIAPIMMPSSDGAALAYPALFRMLVVPGQTGILQVFYPVLPWLGIAMFGLVLGRELIGNRHQAYRRTLFAGAICLILFFILRSYGGFGNYHPLAGESWIDFLNLTKYPPSLTFVLWTVGVNALLLWGFAALQDSIEKHGKALLVFGKTALFFYILHLYMFALVGFLFPTGLNLALMYLIWGAGLAVLYRLCRWYLSFKQRTSPDSLWRFF